MKTKPISVRESAYYVLLPDITRVFLGQSYDANLRNVVAQANQGEAGHSFFLKASSRFHHYSVCFWPDHVSLHAERRQRTMRSRYRSSRVVLQYADPDLNTKVTEILIDWLRKHHRYYQRVTHAH